MDNEIEEIKRRLNALEKQDRPDKQDVSIKPKREKTDYQMYMSSRLKELKLEAENTGAQFDRRQAFGQAAREWTSKKNK